MGTGEEDAHIPLATLGEEVECGCPRQQAVLQVGENDLDLAGRRRPVDDLSVARPDADMPEETFIAHLDELIEGVARSERVQYGLRPLELLRLVIPVDED